MNAGVPAICRLRRDFHCITKESARRGYRKSEAGAVYREMAGLEGGPNSSETLF
jgi:hypothetical protein